MSAHNELQVAVTEIRSLHTHIDALVAAVESGQVVTVGDLFALRKAAIVLGALVGTAEKQIGQHPGFDRRAA